MKLKDNEIINQYDLQCELCGHKAIILARVECMMICRSCVKTAIVATE